ncbi:homeobox-leucine zipper protein HAT22-like [Olea europaea var. sylvestris]|uniref:homeobox-leucine zipper protein HAT22-like n=1 Tax=Olea europaea var. sylvestris TaxID=158386 RepID=UPI000C1CF106|nr:homeobox-leucine zipper protein HAT22-like [Olea europaea var. sylvestris]
MGFSEICNTGLVLGLGLSSTNEPKSEKPILKLSEPSLALSLSGDLRYDRTVKKVVNISDQTDKLYRQDSTVTSLSNLSVKRDRELGNEEGDIERVCSRFIDEDDEGSNGRKKLRLTKVQSALLEESFKQHSTLNPKQKQELAGELHLRPRQVEVWFQNRRARTKLKQTEVDCEYLKKCYGSLTEENRRLQKELQELKAQKLAQPFYMAATLSMCPSCERIGGDGGKVPAKSPFLITPKPHFYSPFANPPATC